MAKTKVVRMPKALRTKRIQLAKDVLAQLRRRKNGPTLVALRGAYFRLLRKDEPVVLLDEVLPTELSKLLGATGASCQVCALGSLFVAHVMRHNELRTTSYGTFRKILRQYFSASELNTIEGVFEERYAIWYGDRNARYALIKPTREAASLSLHGCIGAAPPATVLRRIMRRIVDDNGEVRF